MIQSYKRKSIVAAVVFVAGIACTFVLAGYDDNWWVDDVFGPLLVLGWTAAYFLGIWWYIKAKGREGLWILAGFLNLIGLIVLLCLEDHAEDGRPPSTPPY